MTLEAKVQQVAAAIQGQIEPPYLLPEKVSLWLRFFRKRPGQDPPEETLGPIEKYVVPVHSYFSLIESVAEAAVLAVYGAEHPVVDEMPNLVMKLFDRRALVPIPGAPAPSEPDQVYLKVTVYRYQPDLWQQVFGARSAKENG